MEKFGKMKNRFLFITFGIFLLSNILFARFYIGTETGYTKGTMYLYKSESGANIPNVDETIIENQNGITSNIILGTEHFFLKDYLGIRWGVYAGYGFLKGKLANVNSLSFGGSVDGIANVFASENFSIGVLVGGEFANILHLPIQEIKIGRVIDGREYSASNKAFLNRMIIRMGLSTSFKKHHRIEFIFKYPPAAPDEVSQYFDGGIENGKYQIKSNYKYSYLYEYWEAFLSYKYIF